MSAPIRKPSSLTMYLRTTALTGALLAAGGAAFAQGTPLEQHPTQLLQFETANHLRRGAAQLTAGTIQSSPGSGAGTGNQLYFLGAQYATGDRLTFGLDMQTFEDPVIKPINGLFPPIGLDTYAVSAKYKIVDGPALDVSLKGSVEFFRFDTPVFGTNFGVDSEHIIYSLQAPITYAVSDRLQFHLTPGVSFLPESLNGIPFYGTVGFIGGGVSYRATDRLAGYAAVNVPLGPNGNTISDTATITKTPIWTVGGRFNVTPKVAIDLYATNGIGATPATSILSFFPEGDEPLFGARVVWTPGRGTGYRPSYLDLGPIDPRERALQQDGFTLGSADTHEPGTVFGTGWYGSGETYGAGAILALEQGAQFEGYIEKFSNDGSVPVALVPSSSERYQLGAKLRFLDQNNGDPFSLSGRILGGREIGTGTPGPGVLFLEAAASMKVTPRVALTVNPKLAAFGNTEVYGLGFGVNFEAMPGLQVIGEVTPVEGGNGTVWATGLRYSLADSGFSIDANATNAIGRTGLGTVIAQDDTRFSLGLTKHFNVSGWR